MRIRSTAAIAVAALLTVGGPIAAAPPPIGYLAGREPDTLVVLPGAPAPGSARDEADRAIFRSTRALEGTPRWSLAQNDVVLSLPAALSDFSCAAGVRLSPQTAPGLATMMARMFADLAPAFDRPKNLYRRQRPYLRDPGAICTPRSPQLDGSFDYPSGHATIAWGFGLLLAELMPERASALLQRARAFGESRAICGVHSASAVGEARTAAATVFATLAGDPGFRADLDRARAELAALRTTTGPPEPAACAAEADLTAKTPW